MKKKKTMNKDTQQRLWKYRQKRNKQNNFSMVNCL